MNSTVFKTSLIYAMYAPAVKFFEELSVAHAVNPSCFEYFYKLVAYLL